MPLTDEQVKLFEEAFDKTICSKCKCCEMVWDECESCGGKGGDFRPCDVCNGKGGWLVCIGMCDENGKHE